VTLYGPLKAALIRPLPASFLNALKRQSPLIPINARLAQIQHEAYAKVLGDHVPSVIQVPLDEAFPDSCFIEDTALVVGRNTVITRLGADSRRGETEAVAEIAQQIGLGQAPFALHTLKSPALLDGGDVLQMREHVFVGLSERTNQAAVDQLTALLPDRRVVAVSVREGLHLKSVLSAVSDDILLVAESPAGRAMAEAIMEILGGDARCVFVPDAIAANVLRLDKVLVAQAGFPQSEAIIRTIADSLHLKLITLDMSELIKADGALTCCSVLIPA
jgi:dimethylargininase